MFQQIIYLCLIIVTVCGLIEIYRITARWLHQPPEADRVIVIVTAKGKDEKLEYILRSIASRTELITTDGKPPQIVVADLGMDKETKEVCKLLEKEIDSLRICQTIEIPKIIEDLENGGYKSSQ